MKRNILVQSKIFDNLSPIKASILCMGFGCNAVGVTGSRIINTQRERLIAIITNSLIPCNGRFPTIIALLTIFFSKGNSFLTTIYLILLLGLAVIVSLAVTKLLSVTFLKGSSSSFILELPSYRKPRIKDILSRSLRENILHVFARAVCVSFPMGSLIWLLTHISFGGYNILVHMTMLLQPIASIFGMDGVILTSFILGFPANEIIVPLMMMIYSGGSVMEHTFSLSALQTIFAQEGWSIVTALSVIVFMMFHWPCSTTLLTIKKEACHGRWVILSFFLPSCVGLFLCFVIRLFGFLFK